MFPIVRSICSGVLLLLVAAALPPHACAQQASPSQLPASARERHALVIGNAAYSEAPRLANAVSDASDVCAALKRLSFSADCRFDLRDRAAMLAGLRDFAKRLNSDTHAVVYYAGHAVQLRGENYLVPTHARLRSPGGLAGDSLGLDEVLGVLRDSGSSFNFVVLDACRDDPFEVPAAAGAAPGDTRGARVAKANDAAVARAMAPFGLGAIRDAPAGSIVLYATGSGEPAFDGKGRNGPLTKHFLAHVEAPGVTVEDFLKRVTAAVQTDTLRSLGRRQTPFVYSSFTGQFCFAGCRDVPLESEIENLKRDLEKSRSRPQPRPAPRIPPAM
jgi:uncharacterized caspase-like protein